MLDPREAFQTSSPHWGCMVSPVAFVKKEPPVQSIAALAGTGEAVSAEYVRQRERIEGRHGPNDDGTPIHYARQRGARDEYKDNNPAPISDASPIHVLAYYGLAVRELELLDRYGCETVSDVRLAFDRCEITQWRGGSKVTEQHIREALEMVPR